MLKDSFGRVATDLRVSLTDRCNLRCAYCMPPEGLDWLPAPGLLTDDELGRLISIAVTRLGSTEVRFTGGEPLLRRGLPPIVARTAALRLRPEIFLTTNGIGLARLAGPLREAGLNRLNVSLDTLSPGTFTTLTRRDRLPDVLAGLAAAAAAGLTRSRSTRYSCAESTIMRPRRYSGSASITGTSSGSSSRCPWRPSTAGAEPIWSPPTTSSPPCSHSSSSPLQTPASRGSAPAETFLVNGGPATVGIIASVTRPFCGACDRVRLTADGQIRNCLFARHENDLRTPLRAGVSDDHLASIWRRAVAAKLPGHGINDPGFLQPTRPMSAIGG